MTSIEKPRRLDGMARRNARAAVQREAAARELQEKLQRIEILRKTVRTQFDRMNRAIVVSAFWTVVLAAAFLALLWFSPELMIWLSELVGLNTP